MNGKITTTWPAMPVRHVSKGLSQTDRIDADCDLLLDDGRQFHSKIRIDPTYVRVLPGLFPTHWQVDPCIAFTTWDNGADITISLPAEPVDMVIDWHDGFPFFHMVARQIICPVKVILKFGAIGLGTLTLPEAIGRWQKHGEFLVDPVPSGPPPAPQAEGTVQF